MNASHRVQSTKRWALAVQSAFNDLRNAHEKRYMREPGATAATPGKGGAGRARDKPNGNPLLHGMRLRGEHAAW
jgi:hypothetical protein